MFSKYVYYILGWCPRLNLDSITKKPNQTAFSSKYIKYLLVGIIIVFSSYIVWSLYLNSLNLKGMEIRIGYLYGGTRVWQIVYDSSLPSDINYTSIFMNTPLEFIYPVNVSEYSKSIKNEQVTLQFNDKSKLEAWLDSIQMPNLIRNILKTLLGKSITELGRIFTGPPNVLRQFGGISHGDVIGGGTYVFNGLIYVDENHILNLVLYEDNQIIKNRRLVWDLKIKLPATGSDYEVTFTRYPKP